MSDPTRGSVVHPQSPLGRLRRASSGADRRRLLLVLAGVVLVVGGLVWLVLFSPFLRVQQVEITGLGVLTDEEVRAAAAVPLDEPMATLGTGGPADRVAALRPVAEVSVDRSWPSTVVITVTERRPALAIPGDEGFSVFDAGGTDYLTTVAPLEGVPVLTTDDRSEAMVTDVLAVLGDVPADVSAILTGVRAETRDSITLDLADGRVVVWGSAEEGPRKAEVLTTLLGQPGRIYVVESPEVPAVRQ